MVFSNGDDAMKAISEYNGRTFDGKPMVLELVVSSSALPSSSLSSRLGPNRSKAGSVPDGQKRPGAKGVQKKKHVKKTPADLDADLDSYMKDEEMADAA